MSAPKYPRLVGVTMTPEQLVFLDKTIKRLERDGKQLFKKDGNNQPWTRAGVLRHLVEIAMDEHP